MIRKIFSATVAGAAILIASPALAGPGGHAGGPAGHPGGGPKADITTGTRINTQDNVNLNSGATNAINSQGLLHASPNGIAHASPNSVLGRGAVSSTMLPNLTTGLNVQNSTGTTIGQVSQVVTDSSGNVRLVIVTNSTTGQTFRLAPNTLSINGGVVTTTSTTGG
jgi:hypothetical protein